ncbi:MAG: SPW repeat protein [Tunicatimonas sp.]
MRIIPTKVHGVLDYLSGLLLIASPWLFDFANGGAAQWVPILVGATILLVSLVTDYELSVAKLVSMPTHLALDMLSGALLAASPWLFGFSELVYWPHLLIGLAEIGAGLLTRQVPDHRMSTANHTGNRPVPGGVPKDERSYQAGDVIAVPDNRASTEAQRHMSNDEELDTHVREKEQQRAADTDRARRTGGAEHLPRQHDS